MRRIPLKRKYCYRVRRSFGLTAPRASFRRGQIIRYLKYSGYSHYDAASVYVLEDVQTGERHDFWFFDSDPDSLINEYFERTPCTET